MENPTNYDSWSKPQRQSPAAIFIILVQTIVSFIKATWPIIAVSLFRTKKDNPGDDDSNMSMLIWVAVIVGLSLFILTITLLKYWFYKFHIADGKLVIQLGWLKKKTLSVPLQNIHAVHIEQNVWQRVLQVAKISIDGSGSDEEEAKIQALPLTTAAQLKEILLSQVHVGQQKTVEENAASSMQTKLSMSDLFKFSLTANHLEAFAILIGLSLNLIDNLREAFKFDSWGFMESFVTKLAGQTVVVIGFLVVAVAIISIIVSIIRTLSKFYNFTIEDVQQGWKISFGLLNHQEKIIPSNKIQILSWNANWLRRKLDFWILNVQAIGHTKATKQKQRLQIPVTCLAGVNSLAPVYQRSPVFNIDKGLKIEPDYWKRKTLTTGIPVTLLLGLIFYFWAGVGAILIVLLLVYFGWYFNKWYKVFRWQINDEGLQLYSGVWGRKFTLLTWNKIQQVQMNQNIYQRNHDLATIILYTAGGKVHLPYIQLLTATTLANLALFYVESRDENWM